MNCLIVGKSVVIHYMAVVLVLLTVVAIHCMVVVLLTVIQYCVNADGTVVIHCLFVGNRIVIHWLAVVGLTVAEIHWLAVVVLTVAEIHWLAVVLTVAEIWLVVVVENQCFDLEFPQTDSSVHKLKNINIQAHCYNVYSTDS